MNQITKPVERKTAETGTRPTNYALPRATIREEKDHFLLDLEMPGVRKEDLEVTVENNELTVIGRRKDGELRGELVYRESRPLDYRRVFDLDPSIDAGKITAKIEQGIVKLTLPKAESVKPRKIPVGD